MSQRGVDAASEIHQIPIEGRFNAFMELHRVDNDAPPVGRELDDGPTTTNQRAGFNFGLMEDSAPDGFVKELCRIWVKTRAKVRACQERHEVVF